MLQVEGGDWCAYLSAHLGEAAHYLLGTEKVNHGRDTRFVMQACTKGARRDLISAFKAAGKDVWAVPHLTKQE